MSEHLEAEFRKKLVICHKLIHHFGWDDLISMHLSCKLPNEEKILITPDGVMFNQITEEKLILVDLEGTSVVDNGYKPMAQGTNIHCTLHRKNPNIGAIMHTHSIDAVAVSSLKDGLLFTNQSSLRFYNRIAYHQFSGLALDNEGEEISKSLKNNHAMILRNHGILTVGKTIEEAFYRLYYLEKSCTTQIKTLSMGLEINPIAKALCEFTANQLEKVVSPDIAFNELVKLI